MEFRSFDGEYESEYNDIGFVEISEIFVMQKTFCFGTESFYKVYLAGLFHSQGPHNSIRTAHRGYITRFFCLNGWK